MHPDNIDADVELLLHRMARSVARSSPDIITVHLTSRCNHQCQWCWFARDRSELELDSLLTTLESFLGAGAKELIISGGGEPLLYSNIQNLLNYLPEKTSVHRKLYTHGGHLGRYIDDINQAFDYVRISLDAGDDQTYAQVHRVHGREFQRILMNASDLVAAGTVVGASMVVSEQNITSIPSFLEECAGAGISYALLKPQLIGITRESLRIEADLGRPPKDGPEVFIRTASPTEKLSAPPASCATMAVTAVPEGAIFPCCHLTSHDLMIAMVGSVLDDAFEKRHKSAAERYAQVPHSCRAHDCWRELWRVKTRENAAIRASMYLRSCVGLSLGETAASVASYVAKTGFKTIAITGPSSVGKSTFAAIIASELTQMGLKAAVVNADDFLKSELRGGDSFRIPSDAPLRPESFNFLALRGALDDLANGKDVKNWTYERGMGWRELVRTDTRLDCYILEGLFLDSAEAMSALPSSLVLVLEAPWGVIAESRRHRDALVRRNRGSKFRSELETEREIDRTREAYMAYGRNMRRPSRVLLRLDSKFSLDELCVS